MTEESWAAQIAKVVAGEVRRHRLRRGMSAQQLSDACGRLGHPIARSVLANFESGRRPTVSVPELLVFAQALRVPAVQLVFPLGHEDVIDVLPGTTSATWTALKWFTGEADRLPGDMEATDAEAVRLYREHDRRIDEWLDSREKMLNLVSTSDPELMKLRAETDPAGRDASLMQLFRQSTQRAEDAIRTVRQTMRDRGLIPPDLGPMGAAIEGVTLEDQVQAVANDKRISFDEALRDVYARIGEEPPPSGTEGTRG